MRPYSFLLALFLYAISLTTQAQQPTPPPPDRSHIADTFGFESTTGSGLPIGWFSSLPATVTLDRRVVHTGSQSVRLQRAADSPNTFSGLTASLPVDFTGNQIELTGFLRTADVQQFVGLWLREDGPNGILAFDNMQQQAVRGTRDWQPYRITLPINKAARRIVFGVQGPGTAWADDLQLLVDGRPIAQAPVALPRPTTILDRDHEFDTGSRISLDHLTPIQLDNLVRLGRVWGFLKYHHPAVTSGQRQWDFDLLRALPSILQAQDAATANSVLSRWIDALGPLPSCQPCAQPDETSAALTPDLAWIEHADQLGVPLSRKLRHIYAQRPVAPQFYATLAPVAHNPLFDRELAYPDLRFPDVGFQLLGLFRLWNILQYWSPYRDVAGQNWLTNLHDFIPQVALATSEADFRRAMLAFITRINDSHANLWNGLDVRPPAGNCGLPATVRFIAGQAVVDRTFPSGSSPTALRPGDTIEEIEGVSVAQLLNTWSPLYAASNETARLRDIARNLSGGACGDVKLLIARKQATILLYEHRTSKALPAGTYTHDLPGPTFRLLSPEVAYLKLSTIKAADLPDYFHRAAGAKGLVVDLRNYPSEFVPFALGSHLIAKPTRFAQFTVANLANPGQFRWGETVELQPETPRYPGKVVVLVDETTQSQAEYTAMALQASGAVTIGSQTAGADGNVSAISLPGGLSTMISGIGVFYPDRQPTQRVGIRIDVHAEPTVQSFTLGRDEVLEEGIRQILGPATPEGEILRLSRPSMAAGPEAP